MPLAAETAHRQRGRLPALWLPIGLALVGLTLAGCASPPPRKPVRDAAEMHAQLVTLIPAATRDRDGWADDIQFAFGALDLIPSTENLCAVLAVVAQESTFEADPVVPGLGRIARAEIDRRAERHHVPQALVAAALSLRSPDGRRWGERIAAARTERELSGIFEDFIGRVPLGNRLFGDANPVRTGGPMQVGVAFAERHAKARGGYPPALGDSIRHAVFSRRGGLYFGTAHLLGYPNSYDRHLYRFADFNAGWYASRNAAFQSALATAAGKPLALDGDLVAHEAARGTIGETERAALSLAATLGVSEAEIRRALADGETFAFERGELYARVFALAERRAGKPLPRAIVPRIVLDSPKITRKLTTEWFAQRVQDRYQRCVNQAFGR